MKTKLIATLMLAGSSLFAGPRVSFGIGFGVPVAPAPMVTYAAPAPVAVYPTPCPGPGYSWIAGGYVFEGGRRVWHEGYWRPPVAHFAGRFRR